MLIQTLVSIQDHRKNVMPCTTTSHKPRIALIPSPGALFVRLGSSTAELSVTQARQLYELMGRLLPDLSAADGSAWMTSLKMQTAAG